MKKSIKIALTSLVAASSICANSFAEAWGPNFLVDTILNQANLPTNIDFTQKATKATGNGNGVNKYTENGQEIYYFRGEIDNNNVIWAGFCWKMMRTTATGGIKMIYNGLPKDITNNGNTAKQCNSSNVLVSNSTITVNVNGTDTNKFEFNKNSYSPADVGYMYGARIERSSLTAGSTVFTFSNDVTRNGNTYTLDTSTGQSISGTWVDERLNAAVRYHYFCTDGSTACDNTKIGYIHHFDDFWTIYYLKVDGYNNIEDMKAAMFANTTDSNAKAMIETWFEQQNLDGHIAGTRNYENDLEDTIFCNDRTFYSGALKSKDSDATQSGNRTFNRYGAFGRNSVKNTQNNYEPSLNCPNRNDAFTKNSTSGNGKLNHKIGLATADELRMAGVVDSGSYIYSAHDAWSASPGYFGDEYAGEFVWYTILSSNGTVNSKSGLRPVVSLKSSAIISSGTGIGTDPYIVDEFERDNPDEGSTAPDNSTTPETVKNPDTADAAMIALSTLGVSAIAFALLSKKLSKRH